MNRSLFGAASLLIAGAVLSGSSGARAENRQGTSGSAMVAIDPIGLPIAIVPISLPAAGFYEIETDDLRDYTGALPVGVSPQPADTVISIRTAPLPNLATTLAGADVCGRRGTVTASCARVQVSSPRIVYVWIYSFRTGMAGTADLRVQQMASATDSPAAAVCTGSSIARGCWTNIAADVSFGGIAMDVVGASATGLLRFETTLVPASVPDALHLITFAPNQVSSVWNLVTHTPDGSGRAQMRGNPYSHRRATGSLGTAEWTGRGTELGWTSTARFVLAGTIGGGPIRLIRNDRVRHVETTGAVVTAGTDADSDELGADLENVLFTCDSNASLTRGGIACSSLAGCSSAASSRCRAAQRDTDRDGVRDDLEIHGYQSAHLPLYGAEPARADLFVEIDYSLGATSTCEPRAPLTAAELSGNVRSFRELDIPAAAGRAAITNRDGSTGIFAHFDAAVDGPAERSDTGYGDWGGSQGAPRRPFPTGAACPAYPSSMHADRRPFFRHLVWGGPNAGATTVNSMSGSAGNDEAVFHELVHMLGISHSGPPTAPNHHAGGPDRFNGSPIQLSLMNYSYSYFPDFTTMTNMGVVTVDTGLLMSRPLNPRSLDERCPFGTMSEPEGARLAALMSTHPVIAGRGMTMRYEPATSCVTVDWDGDGAISAIRTHAPLINEEPACLRSSETSAAIRRGTTGGDMAVGSGSSGSLVWLSLESSSGTPRLVARTNTAVPCNVCPDFSREQRYPGCFQDAPTSVDLTSLAGGTTESVAIEALPTAWDATRFVMVERVGSSLRWSRLTASSGAISWSAGGSLASAVTTPTSVHGRIPSLARIGETASVLLAYAGGDGSVRTRVGTWNTGGTSITWQAEREATQLSGAAIRVASGGSPAVARTFGDLGNGLVMAVPTMSGIEIFWSLDGSWWASSGIVDGSAATGVRSRPVIDVYDHPVNTQLFLAYLGTDGVVRVVDSRVGSSGARWNPIRRAGNFATAITPFGAFDSRTSSGTVPGLRLMAHDTNCTACPSDLSCISGACQSSDGTVASSHLARRLPFANGVFAGQLYSADERPEIFHRLCANLRSMPLCSGSTTTGCMPALNYEPEGAALCAATTTYTAASYPACTF